MKKPHNIPLITLIPIIVIISLTFTIYSATLNHYAKQTITNTIIIKTTPKPPTPEEIKTEIIRQSNIFGVNTQFALDLAWCESQWIWNAKNPDSTARGVMQYIIMTWEETLSAKQGLERNNYKANIREAMIDLANGEYHHWTQCINKDNLKLPNN